MTNTYDSKSVALYWSNLDSNKRIVLAKLLKIKAHPYAHFEFLSLPSRKAITEHFNAVSIQTY